MYYNRDVKQLKEGQVRPMSHSITFRLNDDQYRRFMRAVARTGQTKSAFVYTAISMKIDNVLSVKQLDS